MSIISSEDAKTIDQLQELGKLDGTEKTVVSTGSNTRKVSINTILGYIASRVSGKTINLPETSFGSGITFIPKGESIPINERTPGAFYLEETNQSSIRTQISVPASIKVSSNLGLRRVERSE